jgi:hypothetical protein
MLFAENTFNCEQILLTLQTQPLSTTCSRLDWITQSIFSLYCYRYTDHRRFFLNQIRRLRTPAAGYEDVSLLFMQTSVGNTFIT